MNNNNAELGTYIVAHLDVLGFTDKYYRDEEGTVSAMTELASFFDGACFSSGIKRVFGSDNAILYAELGKDGDAKDVVESLIKGLANIQYHAFVDCGLLLRGGITVGRFSDNPFLVGDAYIRADKLEEEAGWARILVDPEVRSLMSDRSSRNWLFECDDGWDMLNYIWIDRPHPERVQRHLETLSTYGHKTLEDQAYDIAKKVCSEGASIKTLKPVFHVMGGLKQVLNYHNQYCDRICGGFGRSEYVMPPISDIDTDLERVKQAVVGYNGEDRRSVHEAVDRLLDDFDRFWT